MSTLATLLLKRKERLELQRKADLLEQEEKALAEELIQFMVTSGMDETRDGADVAYLHESQEPTATFWPAILDYIIENKAPDLLQKRLTASAVKLRWKEGEIIPGIESVTKRSLKFNI